MVTGNYTMEGREKQGEGKESLRKVKGREKQGEGMASIRKVKGRER